MKKSLKIGIITDPIDYGTGGIKTYVINLIEELKRIDKKNEYILIHAKNNNDKIYKNKKEIIIPLLNFPGYSYIRKLFVLPIALKKHSFDLIHEPTQFVPLLKIKKAKSISTVHDLIPLMYPKEYGFFQYIYYKFILPIALKKIDKIIAVSDNTKKDLIEQYHIKKEKIKTVYNGINHLEFKKVLDEKQLNEFKKLNKINYKYALFVGRNSANKNIENILLSFSQVNYVFPELRLIFIGDDLNKDKKKLKLIKKLNITSKIINFKSVKSSELNLFYNCAEFLIFPSKYEGFGLPALEAMSCGCPVITSNKGALSEIVDNAAIKVNSNSVEEIKKAMMEIISNKQLRENLVKNGLNRSHKFSWEKCAEEVLKEYNSLIK
jgi:glycosyltransferase involved in cell wall biosynthesis